MTTNHDQACIECGEFGLMLDAGNVCHRCAANAESAYEHGYDGSRVLRDEAEEHREWREAAEANRRAENNWIDGVQS